MKYYIYVVICIFSSLSYANDNISLFETKSFLIKLQTNCEEGNVSCDNVSYTGTRKSDGAIINLVGKTLNKKYSFDLYGYEFKNGNYFYYIFINEAEFVIQKDNKIISSEKGSWEQETVSQIDKDYLGEGKQENNIQSHQFKDEFPRYCKDINENEVFDGSDQYICIYPNKKLSEIYIRIRNIVNDRKFMDETLPLKDKVFNIESGKVVYQWLKPKSLKVTVEQGAEKTTYIFEEKNNSTNLSITIDTGY